MTKLIKKPLPLPKQWKHWCQRANLRPAYSKPKGLTQQYYLKGRGRYWRVNCHFNFDIGKTYDEFDRWAISKLASFSLEDLCTYKDFIIALEHIEALHTPLDFDKAIDNWDFSEIKTKLFKLED